MIASVGGRRFRDHELLLQLLAEGEAMDAPRILVLDEPAPPAPDFTALTAQLAQQPLVPRARCCPRDSMTAMMRRLGAG